jgi:hypothetical protein
MRGELAVSVPVCPAPNGCSASLRPSLRSVGRCGTCATPAPPTSIWPSRCAPRGAPDGYQAVWFYGYQAVRFYQRLSATCAKHGQPLNGSTFADLQDLANVKQALQVMAQQMQRGMTSDDLQDLAKAKRDLFQRLAERSPRQ